MEVVLKQGFKAWDKNGDGKIDKSEWLEKMQEATGQSVEELDEVWKDWDKNEDDTVDEQEFFEMQMSFSERFDEDVQIQIMWAIWDADGDGTLTEEEFLTAAEKFDIDEESASEIREMLDQEVEESGSIGFEEFFKVMKIVMTAMKS